jgi:hypothetical protein
VRASRPLPIKNSSKTALEKLGRFVTLQLKV